MARLCIYIVVLIGGVIFLPVWVQLLLFALAVILVGRYRLGLFIPALFADVLYAPNSHFILSNFKMTLIISGLLLIYSIVVTRTRIRTLYADKI